MPGPADERAKQGDNGASAPDGGAGQVAEVATPAAEPSGSPEPAAPPDPIALAEERARKAETERKDAHDRMLRVAADFENFKKRTRKDLEEADLRGRKHALTALLPVLDNLERGLDAAAASGDGGGGAIAEGVRLVVKQFMQVLEKLDIKPLVALGEPFDPMVHEAIQQVETADAEAGTVVRELQKGYTMGGKLLRPAMVAVAKAPRAGTPSDEPAEAADVADAAPAQDGPSGGPPPEAS